MMHYRMELIFYTLDSGLKSAEKCATVKNHTLFALIAKKDSGKWGLQRVNISLQSYFFIFLTHYNGVTKMKKISAVFSSFTSYQDFL